MDGLRPGFPGPGSTPLSRGYKTVGGGVGVQHAVVRAGEAETEEAVPKKRPKILNEVEEIAALEELCLYGRKRRCRSRIVPFKRTS